MKPVAPQSRRRRAALAWACRLAAAGAFPGAARSVCAASVDADLPTYVPQAWVVSSGPDRDPATTLFGYNDMRDLLEPLVAQFAQAHGGLRVTLELPGTRFAPAALAEGRAALAPMGAVFTPAQLAAYRHVVHDDPIAFRVAHASLDPRALSGPLAVFVHAGNPVAALTFEQLARACTGRATRWGQLGASGPWADRAIHLYGVQLGSPLAYSMQEAIQADTAFGAGMTGLPQSSEVVEHVGNDELGLGYAAAMRFTSRVRMVAVARDGEHPALLPTAETISADRYPLDRFLLIYARRPLTTFAREFLRLMLSKQGQEAVASTPQRYLPLSAAAAAAERAKIDAP